MNWNRRHVLFGAFLTLSGLASLPILAGLLHFSRQDASASHLPLIPAITAALILMNRRAIFARLAPVVGRQDGVMVRAAALALLIGASAFLMRSTDSLTIGVASLVATWISGFLAVYGVAVSRAAAFPLLFLFFMTPVPEVVLAAAIQGLKAGTAEMVALLFSATGTSYYRQGPVFMLSTLAIEVADECSGIRSSIALLLTSLMTGHLLLRGTSAKLLLVLAVVPVTIFKNAFRIVVLSLLSIHVDPRIIDGQLHRDGGVVFFALALGLLVPVFLILRRWERDAPRPSESPMTMAAR